MDSEFNISEEFYKEETRCDFLVTSKRKRVWAVQLEMLDIFKKICAKYNLKYFAIDGTLLGAARHKGFIPWDDDIDLGMPRADFEKFLSIAGDELRTYSNIIIQHETYDNNYASPHARLTNINTTAYFPHIWKHALDEPQGIFIDIFVYDNVPNAVWKKKIHRLIYKSTAYMLHDRQHKFTYETPSIKSKILRILSRILFSFTNVDTVFQWTQKYIQKYNSNDSCKCFGPISSFYQLDQVIVDKKWFDDLTNLQFENTTIICPKRYDEILSYVYGDWNKMVKGGSLHEGCFYDPDKPYTFYKDKYVDNFISDL